MKFKQEFTVAEDMQKVWSFFQRPEDVAQCMPGIDNIQIVDPDQLSVRMTQKIGPLSASFDTSVRITERTEPTSIQFTLVGKATRGAVGNFRATNTVNLHAQGDQTLVTVEGEAALAGALGSVGQRVIAKQAEKLTAEFAANLAKMLAGGEVEAASAAAPARASAQVAALSPAPAAAPGPAASRAPVGYVESAPPPRTSDDPWSKVAASFSVATFIVSLFVLYHVVSQG